MENADQRVLGHSPNKHFATQKVFLYRRKHCLPVVLRVFGREFVYSCRIDKPLITAYNRIVILSCYNRKMQKIKIFRPL